MGAGDVSARGHIRGQTPTPPSDFSGAANRGLSIIAQMFVGKRTALMFHSARAIQVMLLVAVCLIAPFAVLEVYLVVSIGMTEPYSYMWSIPLGICSFVLVQVALALGVVKGWKSCITKIHYYLMAAWVICTLLTFTLPAFFPSRLSFL